MMRAEQPIRLFLSMPHPCPYLPEEEATTLVIDPDLPIGPSLLTKLTRTGFRRSGDMIYRPHCARCTACVSVRVSATEFQPKRSQRRIWRRNLDVEVTPEPARFDAEQFELYLKYQTARHPNSSMCDPDPEKYESFLISESARTEFYVLRLAGKLAGVAVSDRLADGLSAVYTFFDPGLQERSLGTFAILWQLEHARNLGMDWVYLGYWIEACKKMSYKTRFAPAQGYIDNRWVPLSG